MKPARTLVWAMAAALLLAGRAPAEDAPKPQTFDSQGVPIQYTVEGKGPPVVLVHGLYSSADMQFKEELKKWLDKQAQSAHADAHPKDCICDQCLFTRWKDHKVTIEEAVREIEKEDQASLGPAAKGNPEAKRRWDDFVSNLRPGYELWFFNSPGRLWANKMGCQGYAIFDGPRLVAKYVTMEN